MIPCTWTPGTLRGHLRSPEYRHIGLATSLLLILTEYLESPRTRITGSLSLGITGGRNPDRPRSWIPRLVLVDQTMGTGYLPSSRLENLAP